MPNKGVNTGKGALGGAMTGATIGSVFGPIGMGVGAGVGGLLGGLGGYFGSQGGLENQQQLDSAYQEYLRRVSGRATPQAGPAQLAGNSDFRRNQSALVQQLEADAAGRGPSAAGLALQAGTDRNMAQQQGTVQGARGSAVPLAAFAAANNSARLGAQSSQDAAMLRVQEMQNARNQLGLTLHGARAADESTSKFNAAQGNEMARANLEAELRAMGLNDEAIIRLLGGRVGLSSAGAAVPSMGDQIMAGGAGAVGLLGQVRAGQGAGGVAAAGEGGVTGVPVGPLGQGSVLGPALGGMPSQQPGYTPEIWRR